MGLSPQSQTVYKILLSSDHALSAKELAVRLNIPSSLAYRLTEPLLNIGLISKTSSRPFLFSANPGDEGLSLFLLKQTDWFTNKFLSNKKPGGIKKENREHQQIGFSFIQSRNELMKEAASEIRKATKSVDLLRSGGEISADAMSAIVEANRRGVQTRMLIQDYSEKNANEVANWQKNGMLVRKTKLRHIRLMIFDSSVVYFMSYRHEDSKKDLGMKINYPPFAVILSQQFEDWWQKASRI